MIPVAAKRSVVKLDEKRAAGKLARWQGIAEAAAKQYSLYDLFSDWKLVYGSVFENCLRNVVPF